MHGDKSSGYISMSEKQRRHGQSASQRAKAQKPTMPIIKENLRTLFLCQLEHGSGEISRAVQLSPCSKVIIYTNDTLHKGGGGAEGAEVATFFSPPRNSK